jgi:two-component system, response regulator YesN
MLKVLIVDDEAIIRNGIKSSIPWAELEIDQVYTSSGTEEAEKIFRENQPGIVITDIKMAGKSGLELLAGLNDICSGVKVIILSGFDDFSYAQSALKLGAFDYLLKTADRDELQKAIKRAVSAFKQEMAQKELSVRRERQLEESIPLLKQRYLNGLISGVIFQDERRDALESAGIIFRDDLFSVAVVEIDADWSSGAGALETNQELTNSKAVKIMEDSLGEAGVCFENQAGQLVWIFNYGGISGENEDLEKLVAKCQQIKYVIQKELGLSLSIGLSNPGKGLGTIGASYQEAQKALDYRLFLGKGRLVPAKDISGEPESNFQISPDREKQFRAALSVADKKLLLEMNAQFFGQLRCCQNLRFSRFHQICVELFSIASRVMHEFETGPEEIFGKEFSYIEEIKKRRTIAEAEEWFSAIFGRVAEFILTNKVLKNKKVIEKARQYIEAHYHEDLTLNKVAEVIYMSPNYFSSLFRTEVGQSFLEYLTALRIEKAKILLGDQDVLAFEAGERVGYQNPQYFSKIFKKYTGMTPSEYRDYLKSHKG